ncbi:MAG: hypothetical protein ACT4OO_12640 [Nitrospiraceae bacterium]
MTKNWFQRLEAYRRFNEWERDQVPAANAIRRIGEAIDLYNKLHSSSKQSAEDRLSSKIEGMRLFRQALARLPLRT